ncbi:MAG: hypothetical protein UR51_C0019G0031 [Candidatus Moranbacteria bacterium GW2011_GWF1_34_10]|nr:MAG: hypothetical protein UR51_C0019G0031 [Candidatus Moranbacteria bacterium GW2011_GWF1_34_10]
MKSYLPILSSISRIIEKIIHWLKNNKKFALVFLMILTLWVSIVAFGSKRYADESYHYRQIRMFYSARFEMADGLTTIPGYHAFISLPAWVIFDDLSLFKIRLLSLSTALFIIPIFFFLSKKISPPNPWEKTLILILLPIAAICARQQNIIWHLFIWIFTYVNLYGFNFSFKNILNYFRATLGFIVGIILFFIFIKLNGGIAIGDKGSHPLGIYLGNIYFFLFLAGLLFWPILLKRIFTTKKILKNKFAWVALGVATVVSGILFFYPPELHGYNHDPRFIRNIFLSFIYNGHIGFYSVLVFLGILSLFSIKLNKLSNYLIYPFTILCLLPSWLIEQRYTVIPFLLILLFRKEEYYRLENILKIYYLILCITLVFVLVELRLFL